MILCTGCDQPFEPEPGQTHTLCLACQEIDWYALSNGMPTVMPDGTIVNNGPEEANDDE